MSSKLAWLTTTRGKDVVRGSTMALSFVVMGAHFVPHTLGLSKYKEFVMMYRSAAEVPVSEKIKKLYSEVVNDMKLSAFEKSFLSLFTVYGFDMFHAGCINIKTGALIGIPINFTYETTCDVDRNIKAVDKGVDWESETGLKLQESLVLSDNAKKFAIAREVAYAKTYYPYLFSLYPALAVYLSGFIAQQLNNKLGLFQKPLSLRLGVYCFTSLFGLTCYFFATDFTSVKYEHDTDDEASNLGKSYVEGGIEYYDKLLKRNTILRSLLGKEGEKAFAVSGNENLLIRQKTLPLVHRKLFLEDKLKNLTEGGPKLGYDEYILGSKFREQS